MVSVYQTHKITIFFNSGCVINVVLLKMKWLLFVYDYDYDYYYYYYYYYY